MGTTNTNIQRFTLDARFQLDDPRARGGRGKTIRCLLPCTEETYSDPHDGSGYSSSDGEAVVTVPRYGEFRFQYVSQQDWDRLGFRDRWEIRVWHRPRDAREWTYLGAEGYYVLPLR